MNITAIFILYVISGDNDCSSSKNKCPELCLPTPAGAACHCKEGYEYTNNTCVKIKNFNPVKLNLCPPDHFQCVSDKKCIPSDYRCDGQANCADGSDEELLPLGENLLWRWV